MSRYAFAPALFVALVSSACVGNGTVDGQMVMKCYHDQSMSITAEDGSTFNYTERSVFNEFSFDLGTEDADVTVVGRLNVESEFQLTTYIECDADCRLQCGAPPVTNEDGTAVDEYEPIDLERLTVDIVAGRKEEAGVERDAFELYSPAYYLGKGYTSSGGSCLSGDDLADVLDVDGDQYGDPMAFAIAQLNTEFSAPSAYSSGKIYNPDGCLHLPWGQLTVDDPTQAVRRGNVSGSVQVADMELAIQKVLVDLHGVAGPNSPATFTAEKLPSAEPLLDTVVTKNNDLYDLGL